MIENTNPFFTKNLNNKLNLDLISEQEYKNIVKKKDILIKIQIQKFLVFMKLTKNKSQKILKKRSYNS